ncbi:MAG: MBL fold metallo-hydrolase [Chloroflexi bacterium]|nr:MBL fold metallo-hydrolase [Chloroflexota bacterium]
MEIAPGIHQLKVPIPDNPLGNLNCYLVAGKNGWLMIDTGWYTPEAYEALRTGLKGLGLATTDISTMVITHVHPDHFGLAGRIKASSPATHLITHRWEADLIETRYIKFGALRQKMDPILARHGVPKGEVEALKSSSMPTLQYVITTLPDDTVHGGEILSTGEYDLEVIWTPGHSPGHICLYEPKNKLLFSGDHVLPSISPNVSYNAQSGDNPLGDYLGALRKVQNLEVTKVLPAHEHIFTNLRGRIEQIFAHHDRRKSEILGVIKAEPHNAYYISSRITWDIPNLKWEQFPVMHRRSAVTETIAHLEALRWEGKAEKTTMNGAVTYRAL